MTAMHDTNPDPLRPAIPVGLAHRPIVGGVVVPWVNVALADGGVDFRIAHHSKWVRAWAEGICQTCGLALQPVTPVVVLLGGPNQLTSYFTEPPLHPWCAAYAQQACPMVAGRQATYAKHEPLSAGKRGGACPEPGCDCGGWVPHDDAPGHPGAPSHEWWAVWCTGWSLAVNPDGELLGGTPLGERRRRLISVPWSAP